ncbi:MAG TPA: tRNA pseudouridine(55) synthase TruB [Candidatus Saccharibacteria bacterium]|nr:tRNA pseudouridine(55) synthase TruB [Candidatus Saccharibacteria bacterium]
MDEVLLIDKPKTWTSFDVVAKIRSKLRQETGQKVKVGHAGTLDPLATGLLIILVGAATKRQDEFMKLDKVYEVSMKLGQTSTTADEEGEKTYVSDEKPTVTEIKKSVERFVGDIEQVPPIYSAIKVNGQRAYKLARQGKTLELEPRKVTIYSIDNLEYDYPNVTFSAHVSSGTYIRSLVQDIGQKLGVGAYMTDLRRVRIGDYSIDNAEMVEAPKKTTEQ